MAQGYYTLQEAAQFLKMSVDELKQFAQKGKIRSFQDRGTLRFRVQDVHELARARGGSSDEHELAIDAPGGSKSGGSSASKKKSPPSPKSPAKNQGAPEVFDFQVAGDDSVDVGNDVIVPAPGSGAKSKPPGSSKAKRAATPKPGSDSDVRLVADGSDVTFSVPKDSDVKVPDSDVKISPDPLKPRTGVHPSPPSSKQLAVGSGAQPKAKAASGASPKPAASPRPAGAAPADSGVRLVPMDDDSDVKLHGSADDVPLGEPGDASASDSNVRLEKVELPPADSAEGEMMLTEEINLDEEILKQQQEQKDQPPTKLKAKSQVKLPTSSPFELSDSDLELSSELKEEGPKTPKADKVAASDSSDFDFTAQAASEGSSDFDLVPAGEESAELELSDTSDFSLEAADENSEQVLDQGEAPELTGPTSGISLDNPADEGISLEGGDEASDFDLSLDVDDTPKPQVSSPIDDSDSEFELSGSGDRTPRPQQSQAAEDDEGSSEFDLSLDADEDALEAPAGESSEFELSLEGSGEGAAGDSEGEFELTLDDSGNQEAVADEPAPQVKSKAKPKTKMKQPASAEEQDIFDTDFEVPALDESDDATVADSELESSDFDLELEDSALNQEEESGSQVVALDEDDSEATVSDDDAAVVDDAQVEEESSDFADLDQDVEVEGDVEVDDDVEVEPGRTRTIIREKLIPPAPWGVLPVIFMLPCVVIMFLVGILGFELVQSTAAHAPPGPLTKLVAEQLGTPIGKK